MARFTTLSLITGIAVSVAIVTLSSPANALPSNAQKEIRGTEHAGFSEYFRNLASRHKLSMPESESEASISSKIRLSADTENAKFQYSKTLGNWIHSDGLSDNAHELIRAIKNAKNHGLNPQAYQLSEINSAVDLFVHHLVKTEATRSTKGRIPTTSEIALNIQLNILFETSFLQLVDHLGQGVVDGRNIQKRLYRDPPQIDAFQLLQSVKNDELSVSEALSLVTPTHPGYQRLMHAMSELLTEHASGAQRTKVATYEEAQAKSPFDDQHQLRKRLMETGDLTPDAAPGIGPNAELSSALKAFQARRGLEQDGYANENTRAALNASVTDEIEAVAMSLERYRWLPRDLGNRHIFINIPDYTVSLIENTRTTLTMPAVVGKYKHQTPEFSRDMSYMEYNPTWTVPRKIAQKALIPKERETPGYLVARDFVFLKEVDNQLVKVPTNTVTQSDFNAEYFPYTLRQRGGPLNALGRMKFMMPNKYAIYLHDTPVQSHFSLHKRAYSYGCVRLADPNALAQALMLGDGYDQNAIDKSMQSEKTHRIEFRQPIPTHLVYLTAWVDENNVLQTRPDVYDNDEILLNALREFDTVLSIMNTQLYGHSG